MIPTSEGEWRADIRSCCKVRSKVLCFWKFCKAFDGPQSASAIIHGVVQREKEGRKWKSERVEGEVLY